jgi:hypothetical protein
MRNRVQKTRTWNFIVLMTSSRNRYAVPKIPHLSADQFLISTGLLEENLAPNTERGEQWGLIVSSRTAVRFGSLWCAGDIAPGCCHSMIVLNTTIQVQRWAHLRHSKVVQGSRQEIHSNFLLHSISSIPLYSLPSSLCLLLSQTQSRTLAAPANTVTSMPPAQEAYDLHEQ